MFKNGEDCGRMKVITDKNREYMRTIIKFAVVSVLALFSNSASALADIIKIEFTKFDAFSKEIVHINSGDVVEWIPTNEGHNVELLVAPEIDFLPKKSKMNDFHNIEHVNNLKLSPVAVSVLKRMLKKASSMTNARNISIPRPPTQ